MNIPKNRHIFYMKKALAQARAAARRGEIPIGAIIVDADGVILARAHNRTEAQKCQIAHAEMRAIRSATRKKGDFRLDGCILYVTLEPCVMCFGLIVLSRLQLVVYGASSPLFGSGLDNQSLHSLYRKGAPVVGGVCSDESAALLKAFFRVRRQSKEYV